VILAMINIHNHPFAIQVAATFQFLPACIDDCKERISSSSIAELLARHRRGSWSAPAEHLEGLAGWLRFSEALVGM